MAIVQELVSNFCHMTTRKCKTCGEYKPFRDYDGSQWLKDHKKRQCNKCKPPNQAQTVAAATGTHAPTPVEQHGALGGQSAAGAGAGAAACDVGASADACFQRRCLGLAAPMHAPVVLRVSAFNQNICMRSGMSNLPTNAFGC